MLILGGTVIFAAAAVWYAPKLNYRSYSYGTSTDAIYDQYLHEVAGPITEATYEYIERARENLEYYEGDERGRFDEALTRLEEEVLELTEEAEAEGRTPWLVEKNRVENLYGRGAQSIHRWNSMVAVPDPTLP